MEYMSKYIYEHFREVFGSKSKHLNFLSEKYIWEIIVKKDKKTNFIK